MAKSKDMRLLKVPKEVHREIEKHQRELTGRMDRKVTKSEAGVSALTEWAKMRVEGLEPVSA